MTNSKEPKIQKALIPAGAGIIAFGAVVKILAVAVVGAVLLILGIKQFRGDKCAKDKRDE